MPLHDVEIWLAECHIDNLGIYIEHMGGKREGGIINISDLFLGLLVYILKWVRSID